MSLYNEIKEKGYTDYNAEIRELEKRYVELVVKNSVEIEK